MKLRLLILVAGIGAAAAFAAAATADPFQRICNGPESSLYGPVAGNLTVTGNVYVPDGATLAVSGNLTVAPGACFDAYTQGTVTVGGFDLAVPLTKPVAVINDNDGDAAQMLQKYDAYTSYSFISIHIGAGDGYTVAVRSDRSDSEVTTSICSRGKWSRYCSSCIAYLLQSR